MHAVFMLCGRKELVDFLVGDMMHQKFQLRIYKQGEPDLYWWISGILRELPGGFYDFIFPKEYKDMVLTTLRFHHKDKTLNGGESDYIPFNIYKEVGIGPLKIKPIDHVRKFLNLTDWGDINSSQALIWQTKDISIIPIGIKEDGEITEADGRSHEAL